MNINLNLEIDKEIQHFVEKFIKNGWIQEDVAYLYKKVDFIVNPTARNEDYKYGFGMVLFPQLLSYNEKGVGDVCKVWICCRISIDENPNVKYETECERLNAVADFIKLELKKIGINPFKDEDSFKGCFSKPVKKKNLGSVEFSFYINKDYPDGYWYNHTL